MRADLALNTQCLPLKYLHRTSILGWERGLWVFLINWVLVGKLSCLQPCDRPFLRSLVSVLCLPGLSASLHVLLLLPRSVAKSMNSNQQNMNRRGVCLFQACPIPSPSIHDPRGLEGGSQVKGACEPKWLHGAPPQRPPCWTLMQAKDHLYQVKSMSY